MAVSKKDLENINEIINSEVKIFETKSISTLIVGRSYVIESMCISTTRFGKAIMVLLFDDIAKETFKSWLPKRVVEQFKEDIVTGINSSPGKYSLTYLGQTPLPGSKSRSMISFNLIE